MKSIYNRQYQGIISRIIKNDDVTSLYINYVNKSAKSKTKNILINNNELLEDLKVGQKVIFVDINE